MNWNQKILDSLLTHLEDDTRKHDVRPCRGVLVVLERHGGAGAAEGLDEQGEDVAHDEDRREHLWPQPRILDPLSGDDGAEGEEEAGGHEGGGDDGTADPSK